MRPIDFLLFLIVADASVSSPYSAWFYSEELSGFANLCLNDNDLGFTCVCRSPDVTCSARDIGPDDLGKELYIPDKAERADFSRNQIQIIDSSIFKWTRGLRELSFSRNDIASVSGTSFANLTGLQLLDLSHNRIAFLESGWMSSLPSLRDLSLAHNDLFAVDGSEFRNSPGLIRLDLSYNSLPEDGDRGELPEDQLYSLPHLRYLDLTNCSIRQLPMTAFVNNMELRELRLSKNLLDHIPTTQLYGVGATLEFLDLTQMGGVAVVPNHAFHGLASLRTLVINSMPVLEKIEALAFHDLTSLETLECQNNRRLSYIDPFAFYNQLIEGRPNSVPRVSLNNNGLGFVSELMLDWEAAERVELVGNPLECNCSLKWMASLGYNSGLQLSDYLVCHAPEELRGVPVRELAEDDFGCKNDANYGYAMLSLMTSSLIICACVVLFVAYVYCSISCKGAAGGSLSSRAFSSLQRLFQRENWTSGYNRLNRRSQSVASSMANHAQEDDFARNREMMIDT